MNKNVDGDLRTLKRNLPCLLSNAPDQKEIVALASE